MASIVIHQAGWLAIPVLLLVAVAFIAISSRLMPARGRFEPPRASVFAQCLRFPELYSLFRIRPFARDEWPVTQSEANRAEDENLVRFANRKVQGHGKER